MKAFITGSHAYGEVTGRSDIDLVVPMTDAALELLMCLCDNDPEEDSYNLESGSICIRFGNLNIIAVTKRQGWKIWTKGTKDLKEQAKHRKVSRDEAIAYFNILRQELCVACEGSGKSTSGRGCEPCRGTGIKRKEH